MDMSKSRLKEGTENEYEDYIETETLNSMVPIWRKNKSELKDEDYNSFYKEKIFSIIQILFFISILKQRERRHITRFFIYPPRRLTIITQRIMKRDFSFIQAEC